VGVWGESKPPTAFGTFGVQKYVITFLKVLFLFPKAIRILKRAVYLHAILNAKMAKSTGELRFSPDP